MSLNRSSIFIYPNHSIFVDGNKFSLENAERELVDDLSNNGLNITACAFLNHDENTALPGKSSKIKTYSLGNVSQKDSKIKKFFTYITALYKTPKSTRNADFLYVFFPGHISYICTLTAILLRKPYGLYVRGIWNKHYLLQKVNSIIFKNARFILTTGPAFKDELKQINAIVDEVVPMINIPVNLIDSPLEKSFANKRNAIFVGRLAKSKGIYDVIEAIDILRNRGININLDVIGGGSTPEVEEVNRLILQKGLQNNIILHGHISSATDLATLIANSFVFAFPTTYPEGFPRVVYEAMLLGTPVITTEMPGAKGFLINNENCLTVNKHNPVDLADKLYILLTDENIYQMIRSNAKSKVDTKFKGFISKNHADQISTMLNNMTT